MFSFQPVGVFGRSNDQVQALNAILQELNSIEDSLVPPLRKLQHLLASEPSNFRTMLGIIETAAIQPHVSPEIQERLARRLDELAQEFAQRRFFVSFSQSQLAHIAELVASALQIIAVLDDRNTFNALEVRLKAMQNDLIATMKMHLDPCVKSRDGLLNYFIEQLQDSLDIARPQRPSAVIHPDEFPIKHLLAGTALTYLNQAMAAQAARPQEALREAAQSPEQSQAFFITYLQRFGTNADYEFLLRKKYCQPTYARWIWDAAAAGFNTLVKVPEEINNYYYAYRMKEELHKNRYKILKQNACQRVLAYNHLHRSHRFNSVRMQPLTDSVLFAESKRHSVRPLAIEMKSSNPLSELVEQLRKIKADFMFLQPDCLEDLASKTKHFAPDAIFIDPADLVILRELAEQHLRIKEEGQFNMADLKGLLPGVRVKKYYDDSRTSVTQLNDAATWKSLQQNHPDMIPAINIIRHQWQVRAYHATTPTSMLLKLGLCLNYLMSYVDEAKQELALQKQFVAGVYGYVNSVTKDDIQHTQRLIDKFESAIIVERLKITTALLARLQILPNAAFQTKHDAELFDDNVVRHTLLEISRVQAGHNTLRTLDEKKSISRLTIAEMNDFIATNGSAEQKRELKQIWSDAQSAQAEGQPAGLVAMPVNKEGDVRVVDDKLDLSFLNLHSSVLASQPEPTQTAPITDSFVKLGSSVLDTPTPEIRESTAHSFIMFQENQQPGEKADVRVVINEAGIQEFAGDYNDNAALDAAMNDFIYVLSKDQLDFLNKQAQRYFQDPIYKDLFIEEARKLFIEGTIKQVDQLAKEAFKLIADNKINAEAKQLFGGADQADLNAIYLRVANKFVSDGLRLDGSNGVLESALKTMQKVIGHLNLISSFANHLFPDDLARQSVFVDQINLQVNLLEPNLDLPNKMLEQYVSDYLTYQYKGPEDVAHRRQVGATLIRLITNTPNWATEPQQWCEKIQAYDKHVVRAGKEFGLSTVQYVRYMQLAEEGMGARQKDYDIYPRVLAQIHAEDYVRNHPNVSIRDYIELFNSTKNSLTILLEYELQRINDSKQKHPHYFSKTKTDTKINALRAEIAALGKIYSFDGLARFTQALLHKKPLIDKRGFFAPISPFSTKLKKALQLFYHDNIQGGYHKLEPKKPAKRRHR